MLASSDYSKTVISQYKNSPILNRMLYNMQQYFDPTANLEKFYDYVWNVATAQGFGLDTWGRIVGVTRYIKIPSVDDFFGFSKDDNTNNYKTFGYGIFNDGNFNEISGSTKVVALADDAFRVLILTKAASNISNCSAPSINQSLTNLFKGRGKAWVNDIGGMTIIYNFDFILEPFEVSIIKYGDVLPRPAGVLLLGNSVYERKFGFSPSSSQTFNNGTFFNGFI